MSGTSEGPRAPAGTSPDAVDATVTERHAEPAPAPPATRPARPQRPPRPSASAQPPAPA
ncbi:RDD family protein, partial [Streptomyces rhizosphaericola]